MIATRNLLLFALGCVGLAYWLGLNSSALAAGSTPAKPTALNPPHASQAIPWSQLGARAGADYQGDGLTVTPIAEGARFRCVFQRLAGEVTREGLWLTSTVPDAENERFRVRAAAVGRGLGLVGTSRCDVLPRSSGQNRCTAVRGADGAARAVPTASLPTNGTVQVVDKLVRFIRPGLIEEHSVSMDGVRQDFIIEQRPAGEGELRVELDVLGAKVEPLPDSVQLVLENSGRNIAYSRLRVTDATGKELTARMEVMGTAASAAPVPASLTGERRESDFNRNTRCAPKEVFDEGVEHDTQGACGPQETKLAVVVNDAGARYPVRIDPTFSDANWISMNPVMPGPDSRVRAAAADGSGNLYIAGDFSVVGDVVANRIAKWNGSSWSALGSGLADNIYAAVYALAVSGSDVYAGGLFTTAGGSAAANIAKWNGSSWSALGSGLGGGVWALAVSGSDVYAGGFFTTAGGSAATNIAKWDGSSWSALGSGMNVDVSALAVSGSDVYAGGRFHDSGRQRGQRDCQMEREQLECAGFRDER